MTSNYNIFNYTNFDPVYGNCITIPSHTLLWRSYDKNYPIIDDRPAFFGSREVAIKYLLIDNMECKVFSTTRELRLIDIRYMKVIVNELLKNNKQMNMDTLNVIKTLTLGLGLVSYNRQLKLVEERYDLLNRREHSDVKDLYMKMKKFGDYYESEPLMYTNQGLNKLELEGVRIAETTNDVEISIYLQHIFRDYYDGFIAPRLFSPFHNNNYNDAEILLFNPMCCNIIPTTISVDENIKYTMELNRHISERCQPQMITTPYNLCEYTYFDRDKTVRGGGWTKRNNHNMYTKNRLMSMLSQTLYNKIYYRGEKFVKDNHIIDINSRYISAIKPCVKTHKWTLETIVKSY
jgi:hypothetical protein